MKEQTSEHDRRIDTDKWTDTDLAHLAGFFDGKGRVGIIVSHEEKYKLNYIYEPQLRLEWPHEQRSTLGKMCEYCEDQLVSYTMHEYERSGGSGVRWEVGNRDGIKRFLAPLMEHLVATYVPAREMLQHVLPALEDGRHLEREGFYELMKIADAINDMKGYRESKYSADFFAEKWSLTE